MTDTTTPIGQPQPVAFQFTGQGSEYFRIWIVNLLLSILTLGIYSAWAKVRRNRYFYGNTRLGEASFEYLANPVAILKGRLIAFVAFVLYTAVGNIYPPLAPLLFLVFMMALPWLVVRALQFRARNTAYRNIRFNFDECHTDAFKVYVAWPILLIFTLGLIFPYLVFRQKQLLVNHSSYGQSRFSFLATAGAYYRIYLTALGLLIAGILAITLGSGLAPWLPFLLTPLLYVALLAYISARSNNLLFGSTRLVTHGFRSTLDPVALFRIHLTNLLAIILTLGLYIPWARVRLMHYRATHLELLASDDLSHFIAAEQERVASTGEEMGEMFDVDIGL